MKLLAVAALACLALWSPLVSGQKDYETSSLNTHNSLRSKHQNTPAMDLDADLNSMAQQCAEYYAQKGTIDHTCELKGDAGENLYQGQDDSLDPAGTTTSAAQSFYSEIDKYDYSNPGYSDATGHFTQLVWVDSTKLGVGYVKNGDEFFVVNLYMNAGNMNTRAAFEANVQPLN